MATRQVTPDPRSLTTKQRQTLDRLFAYLVDYFQTTEGIELSERIHGFLARQKARRDDITPTEERALDFIRTELKRGHSPSVREVARALGLKSSRSGFRVVASLIQNRVLSRRDTGELRIDVDISRS